MPRRKSRPSQKSARTIRPISPSVPPEPLGRHDIAESARRVGLAVIAIAALARFTWPGEAHDELGSGQGLAWVLIVLLGWTIAAAGGWIGGRFRFRFSWIDASALTLFTLVALSAGRAADGRVAQNLAWDGIGVALTYLAVRWLAVSRSEQHAWIAALVALGVALALYGAYQVTVLQPETRRLYLENPSAALRQVGLPDEPAARRQFEDRLLGSREPTSVYALTNSLSGVLLVPLLVLGGSLASPDPAGRRTRWLAALPMILVMLIIFLLTKSRGGYLGLAFGFVLVLVRLAGNWRRALIAIAGLSTLIGFLSAAAWQIGQLDRQVLSDSLKSLSYRWEYVLGTWKILVNEPGVLWSGLGPGNFGGAYMKYKLERASETISDPHNLFLDVWTTAGLPALLALIVTLSLSALALFRPWNARNVHVTTNISTHKARLWLWGLGAIGAAIAFRPDLGPFATSANPFEGDLPRWVILTVGWLVAARLAGRIVSSLDDRTLSASLSAGAAAMIVNLLVSGGIAFAPVALMLWIAIALALNLRMDQSSSLVRQARGRTGTLGLLAATAALLGCYLGTMLPYQRMVENLASADAEIALARSRMQSPSANPYPAAEPYYRAAAEHVRNATRADRLASTPWLRWAALELENWEASGRPTDFSHLVWHRIEDQLTKAATPPRDPRNATVPATGLRLAARVLAAPGWPDSERERILADRLLLARRSAALNPTSATVHAEHAEAAWANRKTDEGNAAAARALELDAATPHVDKKLSPTLRQRLLNRTQST